MVLLCTLFIERLGVLPFQQVNIVICNACRATELKYVLTRIFFTLAWLKWQLFIFHAHVLPRIIGNTWFSAGIWIASDISIGNKRCRCGTRDYLRIWFKIYCALFSKAISDRSFLMKPFLFNVALSHFKDPKYLHTIWLKDVAADQEFSCEVCLLDGQFH